MYYFTTIKKKTRKKIVTNSVELSYDSAVPCLGIYPKKTKMPIQEDTCILMFIATLFTIAKIRIRKMWGKWNTTQS